MLSKFPKKSGELTGHVVYEPDGYDKTKKYPVIIFIHGMGEKGDGTSEGLKVLFDFVNSEWNGFMKGLISNKWVLVAPQLSWGEEWSEKYMDSALSVARKYSIDEDRKILIPLSLGGQLGWHYPGKSNEFAGVLPICPVWMQANFCNIKTPVWAFHADKDPRVPYTGTRSAVDAINVCQPPVKAKLTTLKSSLHEIWGIVLDLILIPGESETAWQWMERQKRGAAIPPPENFRVPPPITTLELKADASATLTSVVGTTALLDGSRSVGYKQTPQGYKDLVWNLLLYPAGKDTWNVFPNFNKTGEKLTVHNLVPGEYEFELTAKDPEGNIDTDYVKLKVTAPSGRQQVGTGTVDGQPAVLYSDHTWT